MSNRRVRHQLRLSDDVWNSIKRVRLHLESHILVAEGVATHVSPDEALRLLLSEQGLYQKPLSDKDQQYLPHVMRLVRRNPNPSDTSPRDTAVETS